MPPPIADRASAAVEGARQWRCEDDDSLASDDSEAVAYREQQAKKAKKPAATEPAGRVEKKASASLGEKKASKAGLGGKKRSSGMGGKRRSYERQAEREWDGGPCVKFADTDGDVNRFGVRDGKLYYWPGARAGVRVMGLSWDLGEAADGKKARGPHLRAAACGGGWRMTPAAGHGGAPSAACGEGTPEWDMLMHKLRLLGADVGVDATLPPAAKEPAAAEGATWQQWVRDQRGLGYATTMDGVHWGGFDPAELAAGGDDSSDDGAAADSAAHRGLIAQLGQGSIPVTCTPEGGGLAPAAAPPASGLAGAVQRLEDLVARQQRAIASLQDRVGALERAVKGAPAPAPAAEPPAPGLWKNEDDDSSSAADSSDDESDSEDSENTRRRLREMRERKRKKADGAVAPAPGPPACGAAAADGDASDDGESSDDGTAGAAVGVVGQAALLAQLGDMPGMDDD